MQATIKRIQSRLKKLGIVKSSQQIREVYISMLGQNENPTEQEITTVMNKLSENNDTQITPVVETVDITPTTEEINENQVLELRDNQPEEIKPAHSLTTIQQSASDNKPDKANALVFVDPFSKALAIKETVTRNDITLTDAQIFDVSNSLGNEFDNTADLLQAILAYVNEKYDLDALRTRLIVDETLQELKNKQDQFELELKQKMLKTFEMMSESSKRANESGQKLLNSLKESYRVRDEKRLNK
jgi:hypothetical protein